MKRLALPLVTTLCLMSMSACHTDEPHTTQQNSAESPNPAVEPPSNLADQVQAPAETPDEAFPPAPDLPPAPDTIRIAVISDVNESYGSTNYSPNVTAAIQDMIRRHVDIVISPGDLVAGQKQGLDYDAMWRAFHFNIADVLFDNDIEFIWAPGNHDASAYEGFEAERQAYARAWQDRRPKAELIAGSNYPFYYAVLIRDILIVALDITRPFAIAQSQLDWLESVLHDHANARARLVLGHLPLEPARTAQFWEIAGSPRLIDILQKENATFYISGHHHVFYAGHRGELRTLFAPALGANPRAFDRDDHARNGYLMIEFPPEGPATVRALVAPDYTHMIDLKSLPDKLINIEREDVGMAHYLVELLDRGQ